MLNDMKLNLKKLSLKSRLLIALAFLVFGIFIELVTGYSLFLHESGHVLGAYISGGSGWYDWRNNPSSCVAIPGDMTVISLGGIFGPLVIGFVLTCLFLLFKKLWPAAFFFGASLISYPLHVQYSFWTDQGGLHEGGVSNAAIWIFAVIMWFVVLILTVRSILLTTQKKGDTFALDLKRQPRAG